MPRLFYQLRSLRIACAVLLLLLVGVLSLAPQSEAAAVTKGARAAKWEMEYFSNVAYVRLSDLLRFYGFIPMHHVTRPGYLTYGSKNRYLSLKANRQDFYVNNFRYILSHPVRQRGEELMISAIDVRKLIDPVLRPQYSATAGKVDTVVIDPGHGAHDAGACRGSLREKDCNLQLAKKLRDLLIARGKKVVMTRETDVFLTLQQRVDIANRYPNSIFVSIHHNSSRRAGANGIETFTLAPMGTTSPYAKTRSAQSLSGNNQDSENIALATAVHSRAVKTTGAIDRGIQRARFSVLCTIKRPAILFEGGFVSNPQEGVRISSPSQQQKLAEAMCSGILSYCAIVSGQGFLRKTNKRSPRSSGGISGGSSKSYTGTTRLR